MDMFEKFHTNYTIVKMNKNSVTVVNNKTMKKCFIHRNAFNLLQNAEDFREVERVFDGGAGTWIEILIWKAI